ncbi:MAG: DAK2 domain-containing protein [Thermoguttaceae bacterium]
MTFTPELLQRMLLRAAESLTSQRAYLNELDAAIGDGDHGTAVVAAYNAAAEAAAKAVAEKMSLAAMFEKIGWDVMSATSGSTSTLTGSFYMGMATAASSDSLDTDATIAAFEAGLANVRKATKANIGDKTLIDALLPAIDAMSSLRGQNASLAAIFGAAASAAEAGAATTKEFTAKHGRARNLGERSRGHIDAGATSTAMVYRAFADAV